MSGPKDVPAPPRRSIFPPSCTTTKKTKAASRNLKTQFSPYARCVKVESHKDLSDADRAALWWTKADYADFARVSRLITKAMIEGGSEVWLQGYGQLTKRQQTHQTSNTNDTSPVATKGQSCEDTKDSSTMITVTVSPNSTSNPQDAAKQFHETRDRWWHRFGHSRRGLEHLASIGEGRQRHQNVRASIRAVLQEQERARLFGRPYASADPTKIRAIYLQHTQWARALSRAAGQADAHAVQTNFCDTQRRTRDFYLKAQFGVVVRRMNGTSSSSFDVDSEPNDIRNDEDVENLPVFMQKVLTISAVKLDANTASQICYRHHHRTQWSRPDVSSSTTFPSSSLSSSSSPIADDNEPKTSTCTTEQQSQEQREPPIQKSLPPPPPQVQPHTLTILDDEQEKKKCEGEDDLLPALSTSPTSSASSSSSSSCTLPTSSCSNNASLAKKAQGFTGTNKNDEGIISKPDMSAVLTGQGIIG